MVSNISVLRSISYSTTSRCSYTKCFCRCVKPLHPVHPSRTYTLGVWSFLTQRTSTRFKRVWVSTVSLVLFNRRICSDAASLDWAQHGITGRGVLLDMVRFYTRSGGKLPYDPWTTHVIPLKDLLECAREEGVTFKQGDILILRCGFTQRYYSATEEERNSLTSKPETL